MGGRLHRDKSNHCDSDQILFDARWIGNHGIGRFAQEVYRAITGFTPFNIPRRPFHPLDPWLLAAALRSLRPRLYFSPGYNSPMGWSGRYVFTLHDLNHLRVADNSSPLKRAYYRYVIQPACHRAEFVLTVSEYSRGEIMQWAKVSGDRVVNVGNGVGPPFSPQGAKYDPGFPYFIYAGSHKSHKNLPRLLAAYAQSGVQRDIHLVMTGAPEKSLALEIQRLGLTRQVTFAAAKEHEELAQLYRGALALIFPSLYEGFGLPPVEAMACGTPVLTSDVCSLPEIVGNAALLANPLSVEDIAGGIRHLASDSALRADLREKGLLRAAQFTWEKTASRVEVILQAACQ
jgi:glycosyltransferase involved in cell wall biosynthesis